jgi:hypothetical protein
MNEIGEFYESNHLLVLIAVVVLLGLYIRSIKNRKRDVIPKQSKTEEDNKIKESPISESSFYSASLPIELIPNDSEDFLQILLKTKEAEIITYYQNGTKDSKIWNASKMTAESNVIHNLRSRPEFRNPNWQKANIIKVVVEVNEINKEETAIQNAPMKTKTNQGRLDGEHLSVSYFILDENWFGQNKIITVTFVDGNHKGKIFKYNHDEVYVGTIQHYQTKDSWNDYGRFSNSSNIPEICKPFVSEII